MFGSDVGVKVVRVLATLASGGKASGNGQGVLTLACGRNTGIPTEPAEDHLAEVLASHEQMFCTHDLVKRDHGPSGLTEVGHRSVDTVLVRVTLQRANHRRRLRHASRTVRPQAAHTAGTD